MRVAGCERRSVCSSVAQCGLFGPEPRLNLPAAAWHYVAALTSPLQRVVELAVDDASGGGCEVADDEH
jgi:hypothetical protein